MMNKLERTAMRADERSNMSTGLQRSERKGGTFVPRDAA